MFFITCGYSCCKLCVPLWLFLAKSELALVLRFSGVKLREFEWLQQWSKDLFSPLGESDCIAGTVDSDGIACGYGGICDGALKIDKAGAVR